MRGQHLRNIQLEKQGINKGNRLKGDIESAIEFLLAKSYLVESLPIETKLKLTEKGFNHYKAGKSFESEFRKGRNALIAMDGKSP